MSELNERTALNRRLQEDAEATLQQANEARGRRMVRCINRAYRKSVTIIPICTILLTLSIL